MDPSLALQVPLTGTFMLLLLLLLLLAVSCINPASCSCCAHDEHETSNVLVQANFDDVSDVRRTVS